MEDHSRELKEDLESTASEEKHTKSQVEHQSPVSTSQVHIRRPVMQERVISQSENKEEQDYNNLRFTSHTGSSIDMHSESAGMSRYMSSNINTIDEETTPTSIENHSLQMTSNFGMSDSQSKLKSMQSLPVGFPPSKRSKYAKSHISSAVVNKNPALQMPVPNKRSDSQEKDTQKQSILQAPQSMMFGPPSSSAISRHMGIPMNQHEFLAVQMANLQNQMMPPPSGIKTMSSIKSATYPSMEDSRHDQMGSYQGIGSGILPQSLSSMIPMSSMSPMPSMPPVMLPSTSTKNSPLTFNPMNMIEMSRVFLSSMKDLSNKSKATGVLKFFNEGKGFGFFVNDTDGKDVFFHFEDLKELKITKDFLREAKNKYIVKFAFTIQVYYGKYSYSSKAVDIDLLGLIDLRFLQKNEGTVPS